MPWPVTGDRSGGGTSAGGETFQLGLIATIAGAHLVHDLFTALLAPLLPLLIERLGLSLALAGTLTVFLNIPSLLNPWIGALVDRSGVTRWLVILSPLVTSVGMSLIGLAPSYGVLVVLLLTTGFSVAAIHLGAPVLIAEVSGTRLGRGTSLFMVGGELARTAGPLIAVEAVTSFGLHGLWRLITLGVVASALLWWRLGRLDLRPEAGRPKPVGLVATWRRMGLVLVAVGGVLLARALMVGAMATFLPTMLHGEGATLWFANIALSVFEIAGAAGALTAGTLSDLLGRRRVLLVAVVASPLFLLLFVHAGHGAASLPMLLVLGFLMLATTPVLMAVMLEQAGNDRAVASGTFMMMTFAIRSLVIPGVGVLGDLLGLREAFQICALVALIGVPFAAMIPRANPDGS